MLQEQAAVRAQAATLAAEAGSQKLTAQGSLLSEASLLWQPVLGAPCTKPLDACRLLC